MVRLRGHHLLCLLTFVGEGYTPAFTGNFRLIAARLSAGEEIEIVEGPDDICAPMLDQPEAHCRNSDIRKRDAWALAAIDERLGISLKPGSVLDLGGGRLVALRSAFAAGLIRAACNECEWSEFCTRIARCSFEGTLVQTESVGLSGKRL
ncbi:DUF1284 domain-containing protein [Sinorhizobium americanum]|uniref:Substrate-specific component BioY of biotin ECF transporter n=1 Tax=Sinorhizobium americanum TaxID=194963 RepID=A0A1L3LJL6_9HYPH|nr:DUF1284 domain-containing protein [Sinorhizobium americanum]APG83756.1 substrate-specific component BioY of biotin ECF transporter [Sinorhizobium americanum CCGM7]APG90300.1 substrate-specific component BioY of biotin ECF transporter [Sinorhizobium americanum]OAP49556.1 2Fe-2S ferredoxin [Sinorhizobium americanum]TCN22534.1 hypothetical protein EV184_12495 [Sinorhizobium americanum]